MPTSGIKQATGAKSETIKSQMTASNYSRDTARALVTTSPSSEVAGGVIPRQTCSSGSPSHVTRKRLRRPHVMFYDKIVEHL